MSASSHCRTIFLIAIDNIRWRPTIFGPQPISDFQVRTNPITNRRISTKVAICSISEAEILGQNNVRDPVATVPKNHSKSFHL